MFTIDGNSWDVPCKIERISEIRASEISGMLLDKSYFNDVIGTYLSYNISLVVPFGKESLYSQIYEILTTPVDQHTLVVPYNQSTITLTGRVEKVSDTYISRNGTNYWIDVSFSFISNEPNKVRS